jgi:hypothetical protein
VEDLQNIQKIGIALLVREIIIVNKLKTTKLELPVQYK